MNQDDEQAAIDFLRSHVDRNAEVSLEGDDWIFRWIEEEGSPDGGGPAGEQVLRVSRDDLAEWWLQPGRTDEERRQRHSDLIIWAAEFWSNHFPSDGPVRFTDRGFGPISPPENYYKDPLRLDP